MKKQKYRIIGVIAILMLVASIIFIPKASALDLGDIFSNTCSDPTYKYGVYIEQDENNGNVQYILRRSRNAAGSCGTDSDNFDPLTGVLKITNVSGYGSSAVGKTISMDEEIVLGGDSVMVNSGNRSTVTVYLEKVVEQTSQPEENTGFGGLISGIWDALTSSISVEFSIIEEEAVTGQIDTSHLETVTSTTTESQTATSPEFDDIFNKIYNKAQSAGHIYNGANVSSTVFGENESFDGLKCSPVIKDASGNVIDRTGDNYYQEVNSDYFYAKETTYGDQLTYTYNYIPGGTPATQTTDHACERTCEEALKVEYGMPVASKAGLCFEYKVKVTSYVKCKTKTTAQAPQKPTGSYCNPAPKCISQGGTLRDLPQAGPTEEFDSCINSCDGGKYSEKCSLKCYKQVYGKAPTNKLSINYEDYSTQKLANKSNYSLDTCLKDNKDYYGCYYQDGGKILWASYNRNKNGSGSSPTYNLSDLGRWYIDQYNRGSYNLYNIGSNSGKTCNSASGAKCYVADADGFFRRDYQNSGLCTDICSWRTDQCSGQYMNPGTAVKDYENNLQAYKDAVASCEAAATCSTSTAEFTISADYNYKDKTSGKVTTQKVEFPYSSGKDQLSTKAAASIINTSTKDNTTILDYDGCYKSDGSDTKYMTEWGFPGTWIHNKTGELEYDEDEAGEGYYFESGKYCTPLNALSVNTKWWEYAQTGCYATAPSPTTWNIVADTNDFGYFGWNIRIRCFYGLRNEVCDPNISGCCKGTLDECKKGDSASCGEVTCSDGDCGTDTTINYRIRSVDLKNLFPNEDTRETGFNWTSHATIDETKGKDSNYAGNPEDLIEKIRIDAESGTEELDYKFVLTPEDINEIRKYNKRVGDYGTYEGKYKEGSSVNYYVSDKFFNNSYFTDWLRRASLGKN